MSTNTSRTKPIPFSDEEFSGLLHKHSSNPLALQAIIFANTSRKQKLGKYYLSFDKLVEFKGSLKHEEDLNSVIQDIEIQRGFLEDQERERIKSPLSRYFVSNLKFLQPEHQDDDDEIDDGIDDEQDIQNSGTITSDLDSGEEHKGEDEEKVVASNDSSDSIDNQKKTKELDSIEEQIESSDEFQEEKDSETLSSLENDTNRDLDNSNASLTVLSEHNEPLNWKGAYAKTVGHSHLRVDPPIPCQDAAISITSPRPALFVADGAGSAANSHFGANEVIRGLSSSLSSENLEAINREILDKEEFAESETTEAYAYGFIKAAVSSLEKLSEEKGYDIASLKCTLIAVLLGKHRLFWLKFGDGCIVVEANGELKLVGSIGKGEFANATSFITEAPTSKNFQYGFLPCQNITGAAAFTDGASEKLVSFDGKKIAGRISTFFKEVREGELTNNKLTDFLEDSEIWSLPNGNDDRSIALLSGVVQA
ncbi:PP2C family serine/threonine-protein phosphatase [Adonisia turfae]|nr:PP2C family serine/threonine-protein phosphatase [Adonisia turfae]